MKSKLLSILKQYSYKTGNFDLTSGKQSNYFIDCKETLLSAEGHYYAGKLFSTVFQMNDKEF